MFCVVTKILALFIHLFMFFITDKKICHSLLLSIHLWHNKELNLYLSVWQTSAKLLELVLIPMLDIPAYSQRPQMVMNQFRCVYRTTTSWCPPDVWDDNSHQHRGLGLMKVAVENIWKAPGWGRLD